MRKADKVFEKKPSVDALLITSEKNRFYYTGFASTFGYLVMLKEKNYFITDSRYIEMAKILEKDAELIETTGGNAFGLVSDILKQNNVKTVGFEDTEITYSEYTAFCEKLVGFELVPIGDAILVQRRFKTDDEIEFITKAQKITDKAFKNILNFIKPDVTELDVAVELEYQMRKNGASGLAFDTIVASGQNGSKPHAHPTDKKIRLGDAVTMDFGARYNGYCSDMTRTVFCGKPNEEMRKIYEVVLRAQTNALKNIKCGMLCRDGDMLAREVIEANGYGAYFKHSLGHSLGIDVHELPSMSLSSQDYLQENIMMTVEPGIYIPFLGGVRIEDMVVVKQDRIIDLTMSEKNIIIL